MDPWGILAIVLSIGVIALVGFIIPVLMQLKDVLKSTEITMNRIEKEVEPVISHVEGITGNFEGITGAANSYVHKKPENQGPGMTEKLKGSLKQNYETVKGYVPVVSQEINKYIKAGKVGLNVGIERYKTNESNELMIVDEEKEYISDERVYPKSLSTK